MGLRSSQSEYELVYMGMFPNTTKEEYKKGETLYWWGFSSTTREDRVLKSTEFFGTSGKPVGGWEG